MNGLMNKWVMKQNKQIKSKIFEGREALKARSHEIH